MSILASRYRPVLNVGVMVLYERQPAAVRAASELAPDPLYGGKLTVYR
jgi:hypothetical protein